MNTVLKLGKGQPLTPELNELHYQAEVEIMNELMMNVVQIDEAIGMITHSLDSFGHDPELLEQLRKLITDREVLVTKIQAIK